jgi:RimJ/RimL family protein N-acetyltransferase
MDEITLKRFTPKNIKVTFEWVQDKELQRLFTMREEPSWEKHTAYFEKVLKDETQILFAIYRGDRHIGNCGLKNMEGCECELWIYIGDKSERGKGFGTIACRKLVEIAFNKFRFRRVYLHVLSDNLQAIFMYKALGFKKIPLNEASKAVWGKRGIDIIKMEKITKKMRKYMVIGGGILQCDFIETVKRMGYEAHVFDYDSQCPGARIADVFHCISIDKIDEILEKAYEIKPVGIQTVATELGNITACYVGEKMGLRTNTYKTALNTTDKTRMKKIFDFNNIPNAKYIEVADILEVDVENLPYPVVVKPSDRSAGRGVTLVRNVEAFAPAFDLAKDEANNKIVLIEEVMMGQQFSVETISSEGNHYIVMFTEEYLDGSDNLIESQHLNPARLTVFEKNQLSDLIVKTLEAFDIRYGASVMSITNCRIKSF